VTDPKAIPNIYQRLNAVMRDVKGVAKDRHNKHQGYNYQGHADVTAAVRDAYVRHGIVRSADILTLQLDERHTCIAQGQVMWTNIDDPKDRHIITMWAAVPSTSAKGPSATQSGIALSYLVKQAELKTLSLTDDDTPDAGSEEQTRGQERAQGAAVDVNALCERLETAANVAELQAVRAEVKKHIAGFSEVDRMRLTKAKDAACERLGWVDGAAQGKR
jgi:hypothetical protein